MKLRRRRELLSRGARRWTCPSGEGSELVQGIPAGRNRRTRAHSLTTRAGLYAGDPGRLGLGLELACSGSEFGARGERGPETDRAGERAGRAGWTAGGWGICSRTDDSSGPVAPVASLLASSQTAIPPLSTFSHPISSVFQVISLPCPRLPRPTMSYQPAWDEFAFQASLYSGSPFIAFPNQEHKQAQANFKPPSGTFLHLSCFVPSGWAISVRPFPC